MNTKISIITTTTFHITALSENTLLLSYGNVIDIDINAKIIALHNAINASPFVGFIESVPAYSSIAFFYDALLINQKQPQLKTVFEFVKNEISKIESKLILTKEEQAVESLSIPVLYDGEDLEYISTFHDRSVEEVVAIHTATIYQVFMNGFLPGFAYMGPVDERIITPRKEIPRTNVAAGSVAIAGAQTGIYPLSSPGGWQLIGRTPLKIFDTNKNEPCLFKAGYTIKFTSIDKITFDKLNEY